MSLRELILERIFFMVDEEDLLEYSLTEEEVENLTDLDLLELYEKVIGFYE